MAESSINTNISNSSFLINKAAALDTQEVEGVLSIAELLNQKLDEPFSESTLDNGLLEIQQLTNNKELIEDIVSVTAGIETVGLLAIALKLFENSFALKNVIASETIAQDQINQEVQTILNDTERALFKNEFDTTSEEPSLTIKEDYEIPQELHSKDNFVELSEFLLEETGFNEHVSDNQSEVLERWSDVDASELTTSLNKSITLNASSNSISPEFGVPINISENTETEEISQEEIEPEIEEVETEALASELENNINILFKGLDDLKNNVNII